MADIATKNKLYTYIIELFCKHDYVDITTEEDREWIKESDRLLHSGKIQSYQYSLSYKCSKCDKEKITQSDLIC